MVGGSFGSLAVAAAATVTADSKGHETRRTVLETSVFSSSAGGLVSVLTLSVHHNKRTTNELGNNRTSICSTNHGG